MVHTQSLNSNFLYRETLAAFDNGVKLIAMCRCIVRLDYGTRTCQVSHSGKSSID